MPKKRKNKKQVNIREKYNKNLIRIQYDIYDEIIFGEILNVCCEVFDNYQLDENIKNNDIDCYFDEITNRVENKSQFEENELLVAKLNSNLDKKYRCDRKKENEIMIKDIKEYMLPLEEMERDKCFFGNYPEINDAVIRNSEQLNKCKRDLILLENNEKEGNFERIKKTDKEINLFYYSDEEYEYISE